MTESIEPALDAESWEHRELAMGDQPGDMLFAYIKPETGKMHMGWNGEPLRPVKFPRALAALALNDYFTRQDLETLGDAIYAIHGPKMDALHPGVEQMLDDLRERIKALLPPE